MPFFMNPFSKHNISDFDVYVPLENSQRQSTIVIPPQGKKLSNIETPTNRGIENDVLDVETSNNFNPQTVDGLRAEIDHDIAAFGHDTEYDRMLIDHTSFEWLGFKADLVGIGKSKVINKAIQDIGMGTYQWQLFVLCGFGWLADNLWLQGIALTLPSLTQEFGPSATQVRYTTCAVFIGLCIGASFWGILSDIIGRRPAFNATLFLAGVFGLAAGGGNSWVGTCGLYASLGVGIGGNLPVDGALFLEFLPFASGGLLTLLSVWWPVGQLIASLIAWAFIPSNSCDEELLSCNVTTPGIACCHKSQNMGWRYFILTLGTITCSMFICRFFFFHLYESPKFLLSRGLQAEAVAAVHGIAYRNKKKTWLTEEILNEIGGTATANAKIGLSRGEVIKRSFGEFSTERIAPLFATRRLGCMTCLVWFCWATIGMGYPLFNAFLPQYLQNSSTDSAPTPTRIVYRNYAITSIVGVPGSFIAYYTVDIKYIGRKYTIALASLLTGILLILFTTTTNPNYQLAMTSLEAFFQNIMYGVLYAYTPEIFPAPNRGTATGIASCLNRIAGLCAPIVAVHAGDVNPKAPIYASGALILAAFVAMCLFPIETRGKQSL